MKVKDYPIKNKKGIFPVLLIGCIPFLTIVGMIMAISNFLNKDKISIVPKALISDRISFGSGFLWGFLILLYSFLLTLAFANSEKNSDDLLLLAVYVVPLMITGVFLILQWNEYISYHKIYDFILSYIGNHRVISKPTIKICDFKYDYLRKYFEELRSHGIINYTEDAHNLYIEIKSENHIKSYEWLCAGCGALNNQTIFQAASCKCEYCGLDHML